MLGNAAKSETSFQIWQENWQAICLFCAANTQWRWYESHRMGLIYSELSVLMDMYNVQDKRDCFERIQMMEAEVLYVQSNKR